MRAPLVALMLLTACGSAPARVERPNGVVVIETQASPVAARLPAHTLWQGRYVCAQGPTGLALTLDQSGDGLATAVFDFGALPESPTVPTGRYLVTGTALVRSDGSIDLALAPDRWIAQPPGYVMVGIVASIDPGARVLRGRIDHPSCTGVELFRVQ